MWFHQGFAYVAGFDKPWVVGINTIRGAVEDEGFKVLFASECEEWQAPFVLPRPCGDGYDWIAGFVRTGPTTWIDVPDRVAWVVVAEQPAPPPPPPPPQLVDGAPPPPPPPTDLTLAHSNTGDDTRRQIHMVSEAAALAVVAPVMWLGANEVETPALRYGLKAGAVATVLVDGYLLWSYLTK